ncbi:cupin domain-containing protein [Halobacteriales archaeon QS_9_67_17]|nr:MAG: cupin domain-containing protein [Halobacteriales archaeon QS_9_67_17]
MEKVAIDDVDSWQGPASVKRPVGRALGVADAAVNYYELAPGESFAFGYHRHEGQEEVFYVLDGVVTFETGEPRNGSNGRTGSDATRETGDPDDGTAEVTAEAGELVRFTPGEWQQGYNADDERVRALALGAPADSGETTILRECQECGERTGQEVGRAADADALVTTCVDCGAETGRFD